MAIRRWLVQPQTAVAASPRYCREPSIRRRRIRRRLSLYAEKGLRGRAQLNRPSEPMLEIRATALEEHLEGKFGPVRQLLTAPGGYQRGEVTHTSHNLPNLHHRSVQPPPDLNAVLN